MLRIQKNLHDRFDIMNLKAGGRESVVSEPDLVEQQIAELLSHAGMRFERM